MTIIKKTTLAGLEFVRLLYRGFSVYNKPSTSLLSAGCLINIDIYRDLDMPEPVSTSTKTNVIPAAVSFPSARKRKERLRHAQVRYAIR